MLVVDLPEEIEVPRVAFANTREGVEQLVGHVVPFDVAHQHELGVAQIRLAIDLDKSRHRIDDQSIRPCTRITISGIVRSSVAIQIEPERVPRASRSGESATSMRNVELEPRGAFVSRRAGTSVRNDATLNSPARFLTR